MQTKEILIGLIFILALLGGIIFLASKKSPTNSTTETDLESLTNIGDNVDVNQTTPEENTVIKISKGTPEMVLKDNTDYKAVIKTSMGDIAIDLFEKESPKTVNNFVKLASDGFYNGIIFHRVIEDFMIQGGDPTGTGTGGPGYTFEDEFNDKPLVKGSLAMANAGPNTNGSQFFIVTAESTPWLDGRHTNFGQVTSGIEIVDAISKVEKNANDKPLTNIVITGIEITEN